MACNRSVIVLVMAALLPSVISIRVLTETQNGFKEGDRIPLFANTVHYQDNFINYNSCDIYPYFEFPFCPPGEPIYNRKKSIEEILYGDCFTPTQYELKFKVGTIGRVLCEKNLTKDEVSKFRYAVTQRLIYHMYYNGIMFVGSRVGFANDSGTFLVTHIDFYPHYYENQVTEMFSTWDPNSAVDITQDTEIKVNFTYSVFWKELYRNSRSKTWMRPAEISSWQSVFIIILYVTIWPVVIFIWPGLLLKISVSYLMRYFTRSSVDAGRSPPYSSLLGAILAIGIQHLIVICYLFYIAYKGVFYPCQPDSVHHRLMIVYCLSSVVSGYTATTFHARYSAHGWEECVFQTGALYFVPVFLTIPLLQTVLYGLAKYFYVPTNLDPFALVHFMIWGLVTVPFLILGGRIGYYFNFESQGHRVTSRTQGQRDIPQQSWWMSTPGQMFLGGLLPFMTIFRDMDEIYASLWSVKVCGAFSLLFKAFLQVIIMTIFVGMGYTYHQMSKQDAQWWWRSVLRGGSTAIYMFAYGIYFHFSTTGTINSLPNLLYVGYYACISYSFFLVLGTIGFFASSIIAYCMHPRQENHMYPGQEKHE